MGAFPTSISSGTIPTTSVRVGLGRACDRHRQPDQVSEPGDLGVEELRAAASADDDDLGPVEPGGAGDGVLVVVGGSARPDRRAPRSGRTAPPRSCRRSASILLTRAAQSAPEGDRQQVDQAIQRTLGVGGQLLDGLEVEEEVAAGGVRLIQMTLDAVETVDHRDDASRAWCRARSRGARRRRPCRRASRRSRWPRCRRRPRRWPPRGAPSEPGTSAAPLAAGRASRTSNLTRP